MWLKQSVSLTDLSLELSFSGTAEVGSVLAKSLQRSSSLTRLRLSYAHGRQCCGGVLLPSLELFGGCGRGDCSRVG